MNTLIASELSKKAMKINRANFTGSQKIRNTRAIVEINEYPKLLEIAIYKLSKSRVI